MGHNEYNVVALHPCRAPLDLTGWPKKTSGWVVDDDVVAVLADCKAFSVGEKHVSKHTKSCELNVVKSCVRLCAIIQNHVKNCEIMSDSSEIIRHHMFFYLKYNTIMWNPVIPGMFFVQKALADLAVGCWRVLALGVTRVLNAGQKNRKWFMILYTLW